MTYRVRHAEMHQEEDVVRFRHIATFLGVTLGISAIMVILALWLLNGHKAELRPSGAFPERYLGPRHAVARVRQDVFGEKRGRGVSQGERAREDLSSYGWVDEAHGVVRIPIDRAIDLVVEGRRE
jgi:hypothetical protein